MNIHPAFVHFPIALLMLYSVIEVLPMARIWNVLPWDQIRRFLLYVGALSAAVTAVTGGMAADLFGETPAVEAHESAALTLVALAILLSVLDYFWKAESTARTLVMKIGAAVVFLMLFVVGALGSNLVYGKDVDPIVSFVVKLFGI